MGVLKALERWYTMAELRRTVYFATLHATSYVMGRGGVGGGERASEVSCFVGVLKAREHY